MIQRPSEYRQSSDSHKCATVQSFVLFFLLMLFKLPALLILPTVAYVFKEIIIDILYVAWFIIMKLCKLCNIS